MTGKNESNLTQKVFTLRIDVANAEEGQSLFSQIVAETKGIREGTITLQPGDSLEVKGRLSSYVTTVAERAGVNELIIDLSSTTQQRLADAEWAYYSSFSRAQSLSRGEIVAFGNIAEGSDYQSILGELRKSNSDSSLSCKVREITMAVDYAISRWEVNCDIVTYRADSYQGLRNIWEQTFAGRTKNFVYQDKAYGFTTLDPEIAREWNGLRLGSEGVLLEIKVPAGAHAAYFDANRLFTTRGYLEFVLPRNYRLRITGARREARRTKILQAELLDTLR